MIKHLINLFNKLFNCDEHTRSDHIALTDLVASSHALLDRFGIRPNIDQAWTIHNEEVDELKAALTECVLANNPDATRTARQHAADELIDEFVSGVNALYSIGVTAEEITAAARRVMDKNDAKTHATHTLNGDGKIARKP